MAGRDATVIVLSPRDALRFAQRLWADQATGMLLRADVLAADGSVVESSAFSMIEFDVSPQPELVLQPLREEAGLRIVRPHNKRTRLEAEGWQLVRPVPGFALEGCVLRGSELGGKTAPMLQVVFSDGLTHVSVFVERFSAERHRSQAPARSGATHTLARRTDDHWITVVGDVPPATLRTFVKGLERRK